MTLLTQKCAWRVVHFHQTAGQIHGPSDDKMIKLFQKMTDQLKFFQTYNSRTMPCTTRYGTNKAQISYSIDLRDWSVIMSNFLTFWYHCWYTKNCNTTIFIWVNLVIMHSIANYEYLNWKSERNVCICNFFLFTAYYSHTTRNPKVIWNSHVVTPHTENGFIRCICYCLCNAHCKRV